MLIQSSRVLLYGNQVATQLFPCWKHKGQDLHNLTWADPLLHRRVLKLLSELFFFLVAGVMRAELEKRLEEFHFSVDRL